jgi:nucleoside-diphosphate-sugar epimerase
MRIFVTGASGFIGSAVVPELLNNGHEVLALARTPEKANALKSLGAEVQLGSLADVDDLRKAAESSDGVIHLAFDHDIAFSGDYAGAATSDLSAIEAFGAVRAGSERPLVIASGVAGFSLGRPVTETDRPDPGTASNPRVMNAEATLALADCGVRSAVLRLPPTVHGEGDGGFIASLIAVARTTGIAGYIDDGANRWSAVHRYDAARLFRLAVESAAPGSVIHGVADEGVSTRDIATTFGKHLGLPVRSIEAANAGSHFGWIGTFFGIDASASSAITQATFDWHPGEVGLLEDLDQGHYFATR